MGIFLPTFRSWNIINTDTFQFIQGQFEPVDGTLTKEVTTKYAEHVSLNRQNPIIQFLSGTADVVSFQARLFNGHLLDFTAEEQLTLLELWTKRDSFKGRPPIIEFWVGDAHLELTSAVIVSLSGITFGRPTFFGGLREVSLQINLKQYKEFNLDDEESFETRFHRSRARDYYELLTEREYKNPLVGDVIRKRHPTKPNIQTGDLIKLPSFTAIRKDRVEQKSVPLKTGTGRKDTAQRALRLRMFDLRNRPFVSHIIVED